MGKWKDLQTYLSETNHPWVQLFYVLVGPVAFYVCSIWVLWPRTLLISLEWFYVLQGVAAVAFYYYVQCCLVDPGKVTPENKDFLCREFASFENGVDFKSGVECKTCGFVK